MAKKGRSEKGVFGTIYHYDEYGRKVGRSEPKLFGDTPTTTIGVKRLVKVNLISLEGIPTTTARGAR